ncbi:MAG TPA: hypothetical protein DDZ51_17860 [Planctomycetaceae bacterium]|nr:hypothetical protein [Planctomycetaceae bacterium]
MRKENKKNLMILSNSPYCNGGFQTLTRELGLSILERGGEVQFVCFQANPYRVLQESFPQSCCFRSPPEMNTRNIRPSNLKKAYDLLRLHKPDVLFFCNSGTPDFLPFMVAARWAGVCHVVVHHGTDVDLPPELGRNKHFGGLVPGLGLWRKELIYSCRFAFRRASLILFNNDSQMENWRSELRLTNQQTALWYPPMDLAAFGRDTDIREKLRREIGVSSNFVIGCVGHLNRQKSFDVAIRAMVNLKGRMDDAVLVIAGEGGDRQNLEKMVADLDLQKNVILLGDRNDIPELMNAFDLFCLPSTLANETLGIVILEAMATGVPVVVSDLPGPARLSQQGRAAITVPAGDHVALADAWCRVCGDEGLRQYLVANALKYVRQCDRSYVLDDLLARLGEHKGKRDDSSAYIADGAC